MKVNYKPNPKSTPKAKKAQQPIKRSRKDSGYKKLYLDFFGFKDASDCYCEIPHCGRMSVNVFLIEGDSVNIENQMSLCKAHKDEFIGVKKWVEFLNIIHEKFMSKNKSAKRFVDAKHLL